MLDFLAKTFIKITMKELETCFREAKENKVEISVKKQRQVEYVLAGVITPKQGHFIWEVNTKTGEIKLAEYKRDTLVYNSKVVLPNKKLVINSDCLYIPALNKKNAYKHFLRDGNQSAYYAKPALMDLSNA